MSDSFLIYVPTSHALTKTLLLVQVCVSMCVLSCVNSCSGSPIRPWKHYTALLISGDVVWPLAGQAIPRAPLSFTHTKHIHKLAIHLASSSLIEFVQWLGHRTGNHTHTYKISWHERSPSLHPTPWAALSRASVVESCRVGSFPHLITILIEPVQPSLRSPDDRYRKWVALKKSSRSPSPPAPKRQRTLSVGGKVLTGTAAPCRPRGPVLVTGSLSAETES